MIDATIQIRFKTTAEGGRIGPIQGKQFSCPMLISGEAFDCRLETGGRILELGETYEVPIRFLNPQLAVPKLTVGKEVVLWEGKEIATGRVLRLGK